MRKKNAIQNVTLLSEENVSLALMYIMQAIIGHVLLGDFKVTVSRNSSFQFGNNRWQHPGKDDR